MMARLGPALWIAAVCLICYSGALTNEYGLADDYPVLVESTSAVKWLQPAMNQLGRGLNGLLMEATYGLAGSVASLRWVRLLSITGIVATGWLVYWRLEPKLGWARAGIAAAFLCTLPSFEIGAAWAQLWAAPYAAAMTLFCYRAFQFSWWRCAAGMAVAIAALSIYQPAAMFFWVWAALDAWARPKPRAFVRASLLFAASGVVYAAGYALSGAAGVRFALTDGPLHRAGWFVGEILPSALRFAWIDAHWLWIPMALVAALAFREAPWWVLFAIPLAYAPSLLAREEFGGYRTEMALTSLLALLFWIGFFRVRHALQIPLACVLLALAVGKARSNVERYIVRPNAAEYAALKQRLRGFDPARHRSVRILTGGHTGSATRLNFDEFGVTSADLPPDYHLFETMTILGLRDLYGSSFHVHPSVNTEAVSDVFTVDMRTPYEN